MFPGLNLGSHPYRKLDLSLDDLPKVVHKVRRLLLEERATSSLNQG